MKVVHLSLHKSSDLKFVQLQFDEVFSNARKISTLFNPIAVDKERVPSTRNVIHPVKLHMNSLLDEKAKLTVVLINTSHHVQYQEVNDSLFQLIPLQFKDKGMPLPVINIHCLRTIVLMTILKFWFYLVDLILNILNHCYLISAMGMICISVLFTIIVISGRTIFSKKEPVLKIEYPDNRSKIKSLYFIHFESLLSNLFSKFLHNWNNSDLLTFDKKCIVKNKATAFKQILSPSFTQLRLSVYPIHDLSRLASFRPLSNLDSPVAFIRLAASGFSYSGQGNTIICSGCQKKHDLLQVATDPTSSVYHHQGCIYIQPDEQLYSEVVETDSSSAELRVSITSSNQQNLDLPLVSSNTAVTSVEPITLPTVSTDGIAVYPQTSQQASAALGHPSYPIYVTLQKRLETFVNWPIPHIQNFRDLAAAGFFFAGYADCVRCFHCGLGLKTWKPADNVYVEHERLRPSCPFLQAQLVSGRSRQAMNLPPAGPSPQALLGSQINVSQQASNSPQQIDSPSTALLGATGGGHAAPGQHVSNSIQTDSPSLVPLGATGSGSPASVDNSVTKSLLERENKLLHQLMTCKICKEEPIKELFLPCGDLYACSHCSQRMTHCPLCKKKILGAVTVYFA